MKTAIVKLRVREDAKADWERLARQLGYPDVSKMVRDAVDQLAASVNGGLPLSAAALAARNHVPVAAPPAALPAFALGAGLDRKEP